MSLLKEIVIALVLIITALFLTFWIIRKRPVTTVKVTPPRKVEFLPTPFSKYVSKKDNRYDHRIQEAVAMIDDLPVDWRVIKALIKVESDFDPDTLSYKGAMGLMQLMPDTATELGVKDIFNPTENIRAGVKYFMWLWERWSSIKDFDKRLRFVLASYNAGYIYMRKACSNNWDLTQTWAYVDKVLKWYKIYKEMDN